jgi:pyruvate/2-oxoglutarate dehydrogenase complex dihydrolipoamide dehydrogenase (E3) component
VEGSSKIGGQLKIASVPPHKGVIAEYASWLSEELVRCGVDVQLNKKVDLDYVKKAKPDLVLLATGSKPLNIKIPGYEYTKNSWTVLDQFTDVPENKNISIIGGGIVGCETAELLASKGNKVTVFEMAPAIASGLEKLSLLDVHVAFATYGVDAKTNTTVLEVKEDGLVYKNEDGSEDFCQADEIIMSIGQKPVRDGFAESIYNELGIPARYIGDAKEVGKIVDAVQYGYYAGLDI